jgi:hypothetical protein
MMMVRAKSRFRRDRSFTCIPLSDSVWSLRRSAQKSQVSDFTQILISAINIMLCHRHNFAHNQSQRALSIGWIARIMSSMMQPARDVTCMHACIDTRFDGVADARRDSLDIHVKQELNFVTQYLYSRWEMRAWPPGSKWSMMGEA